MDQLKKNLFWIILGVLVLIGIGVYVYASPDLATAQSNALEVKGKELSAAAAKAGRPDGLLTTGHVRSVNDYLKSLEAERAAFMAVWKAKKFDLRFPDVPNAKQNPIEFDNWLNKLRDNLKSKMTTAKVKIPPDFDKLTFSDSGIDDGSADIHRHRDYRLRYMAVFDEVVDALCSKTGLEEVRTFEPDPAKAEVAKNVPVGPLALNGFALYLPDEWGKAHDKEYDHAVALSGRVRSTAPSAENKPFAGLHMPVKVTGIEVEFMTHISALNGVVRKFEATSRYFAIVTRVDFERSGLPYPTNLTDTAIAANYVKPVFDPMVNSHYGEGPVRAVVSFEIYEYDETTGKDLESKKVPVTAPSTTTPAGARRPARPVAPVAPVPAPATTDQ